MISTSGMSPILALTLIKRERETFEKGIRNEALAKQEISAFKDRIGSIGSVDDLMKDYKVYSFVMKSFGLEDEMPYKAMIRRIVTSDPLDKKSLANRLTRTDYQDLNKVLGFGADGKANPGVFGDPKWVQGMVDRYVGQRLVDSQADSNPVVGEALQFLEDAPRFTNWYKVLANKGAANVMRVALGLPDMLKSADVDAQKRAFEKKMNIADLKDPKVLDGIVRKYAAIQGANQAAASGSGLGVLFSPATSPGNWAPITIDISGVSKFRRY